MFFFGCDLTNFCFLRKQTAKEVMFVSVCYLFGELLFIKEPWIVPSVISYEIITFISQYNRL